MELEHGWYRSRSAKTALERYLDEIFAIIPVEPFNREMGALAAKIDAEARRGGQVIALADLMIGATALHYGFSVGTKNVRHFLMISGLDVVRF